MSRALDFQIRYGNADELDNYDPMGDVYNNIIINITHRVIVIQLISITVSYLKV